MARPFLVRRLVRACCSTALVVLASLVAATAFAQGQPIRFDRLTTEDGLSQSAVWCTFQDSRGFVWLCTEDGLNQHDGYTFRVFKNDPADPTSLADDMVWAVDEDFRGDLWIATDGGGVARWERSSGRFVAYRYDADAPGSPASDSLRTLLVDRDGHVWVGTKDAGLDRLDPSSGVFTHYRHDASEPSSLSHDGVYALHQDSTGRLWVGTEGGLNRYDPESDSFVRVLPEALSQDQIRSVLVDGQGSLWAGTYQTGLIRIDAAGGHLERFRPKSGDPRSLSHDRVPALFEDDAGRLWVGTGAGLNLLNRRQGDFSRYTRDAAKPRSLSDNNVLSIAQDRGGILWVGTRNGGVNKWNPATWSFGHIAVDPSNPTGLSNNNATSFSEGPHGKVWIGTFGGGLNVLDPATGRIRHYRHEPGRAGSLSDDRVMAVVHDRSGTLWVGTQTGGLNRYDATRDRFEVLRHDPGRPDSISSNAIMSLLADSRGLLWIGTFGEGLNRLDPRTNSVTVLRHDPSDPNSLGSDVVTCLVEDPSGALWVGTDSGGLNYLDPATDRFHRFQHVPEDLSSLSGDTVFSLYRDGGDTLWVGTRGGGLNRLEQWSPGARAAFRHYTEREGLPNDMVYGIREDVRGHLWLSTNNGLARLDPETESFTSYNERHGVQSPEFHFGSHYAGTSGRLYFGGPGGINAFFPEELARNTKEPPVVLTGLLRNNKAPALDGPLALLSSLELGYRDHIVTFEFAALDFAAPEKNRYAYLMDGFDPEWVEAGTLHRATYTNLSAGDYVFRVRAANNDGVWNEDGLAIRVRVLPPPWRSWWASALYGAILGAAAYAFVRNQRRKAQQEAEYSRRLEVEVEARTQELAERGRELETLNQQLLETSVTDSLTGLRNRRFLFEEVAKDLALADRAAVGQAPDDPDPKGHLLFIMVDLDWFKPINDTCGHNAGDEVLKQVKILLQEACRSSDVLIRWGGDEFLVVGRSADLAGAQVVPERIRSMIEKTSFDLGNGQVAKITCSVGFTAYPIAGTTPLHDLSLEQIVTLADGALYAAKRAGRNTWVGLLGTDATTPEDVLRATQDGPDPLVAEGKLEFWTPEDGIGNGPQEQNRTSPDAKDRQDEP